MPASPPTAAHPMSAAGVTAAPPSQAIWSTRLMDLLSLVRHEFDIIGSDAVHFKSQRDELEHRSASAHLDRTYVQLPSSLTRST